MISQAIYFRTSSDLAASWSSLTRPVDTPLAVWGPVLHYEAATQRLWLFHSASGKHEARSGRGNASYPGGDIRVATSKDDGTTWTEPRTILSWAARGEISKVTANKMAVSANGTWVLPFWQEGHTKADRGPSCAGVLRSVDQGATWDPSACLASKAAGWLIENSLAPLADGRLLMVFRTRCGKMYKAFSSDDGVTWTDPTATPLDNPNAKIALFRRSDGPGIILAYNPSTKHRSPLALATTDDGEKWEPFVTIEDNKDDDFDYPTPSQVGDKIYTTYSALHHRAIKLAITALP